ncbi:MAG: ribosome assembly RNA-binding protein YhbY [Gammaproteobacteria bacterium]|nr:ribosome assembly RNA-binding protein YhbY [Gammaproteobacteria bacterium]
MKLTGKQTQFLRSLAHPLKPVVMIGDKGLTENVLAEIEGALDYHELIKIKVPAGDKDTKSALIEAICKQTKAAHAQTIGRIVVLFRSSEKKKITLP